MSPLLDDKPTTYTGRPGYEGANIRTWIGFKHFMYLAEQAVLEYFRERGAGPETLYHRYGLGLEIADASVQLPATIGTDDVITGSVAAAKAKPGDGAYFTVRLTTERDGETVTNLTGKVRVALVSNIFQEPTVEPIPEFLLPYVVTEVSELPSTEKLRQATRDATPDEVRELVAPSGSNAFLWSWRIPYPYCRFSDRMQHSGYVRVMEEVVDRFLDSRGLSIATMLAKRGWIPVVSRARIQLMADALMEETLHIVFTVEEVLKDIMYPAKFDAYVLREGKLIHTATGSIIHGYGIVRGEGTGGPAIFDEDTKAALLGGTR
jgi:acyl-CoA thioesterase FadM